MCHHPNKVCASHMSRCGMSIPVFTLINQQRKSSLLVFSLSSNTLAWFQNLKPFVLSGAHTWLRLGLAWVGLFCFSNRVSLCGSGCPGTDFNLICPGTYFRPSWPQTHTNLHAFVSQVLELKACTTIPDLRLFLVLVKLNHPHISLCFLEAGSHVT
jgi:hypothetical protein